MTRILCFLFMLFLFGMFEQDVNAQARNIVPESASDIKLTFAPIVKQASPSVVNVYASRKIEQRKSPIMNDPFFRRFFGNQSPQAPRRRVSRSLGSGVIVDESGVIVTNFHVIAGASAVKIALADRREFDADIILRDEETDLAILKVRNHEELFPALTFGASESLEVGDLVLAIGNPFGVGQTVTQGIVSALARSRIGVSDFQFFIQTDAAINPGNSGGALLDMQGRLIGINTAIFSRSGGSNGIGFAIPSEMVKVVVSSALGGYDSVMRPWIGADFQNVTSDIAQALRLARPRGILVANVREGGPAESAGLKANDLVLAINDFEISDMNAFGYRLATLGISSEAELTVIRSGVEKKLNLALIAAPETVPRDARFIRGRSPFAGAQVLNLSPAVSEEMRFSGAEEGVIVEKVQRNSPAQRVGLRRGDIVLSVSGIDVSSTAVLEQISQRRQRFWEISIGRGGKVVRFVVNG